MTQFTRKKTFGERVPKGKKERDRPKFDVEFRNFPHKKVKIKKILSPAAHFLREMRVCVPSAPKKKRRPKHHGSSNICARRAPGRNRGPTVLIFCKKNSQTGKDGKSCHAAKMRKYKASPVEKVSLQAIINCANKR